jgi:hypothetical protein
MRMLARQTIRAFWQNKSSRIRVGTLRAGLTLLERRRDSTIGALIARRSVTVPNSHATSGTLTVDRRASDAAAISSLKTGDVHHYPLCHTLPVVCITFPSGITLGD